MKPNYAYIILFIFYFLSNHWANGQERLDILLDSLAIEKVDKNYVDLCLKIASELKYKDKSRTTHYIELGKEKAEEANDDEIWKNFYNKAFHIYSDLDALDVALVYLLKEYDFYKDSNELKRFEIENQLGIINARLNNPEKALFYFKKILLHYQKEKKYELIGKTYNNIGLAYLSIEKPDSAVYFLNKGIQSLQKSPNLKLDIHLKTNLARSYDALKQFEKAEIYFSESSNLIDETIENDIICWVYMERSKFYLDHNQPDKSIEFALKAEELEPTKSNFTYLNILKVLYKAYYQKKDYEKSTFYFSRFDEVRDNLNI